MEKDNLSDSIRNQNDQFDIKVKGHNANNILKSFSKKMEDCDVGIQLKQRYETQEDMTGCEFPNIYFVYKLDKNKRRKGDVVCKWMEKTNYLNRISFGACKGYNQNCYNYSPNDTSNNHMGQLALKCTKDCRCSYLCLNRQEMKCSVFDSGEEKYLGKVVDPYDCVNFIFLIYNDIDRKEYSIEASCCQCYFWCRCPCEGCDTVNFEIRDANNKNVLSDIVRKGSVVCGKNNKENRVDLMDISFPAGSDWRQRSLLMCTGIFLDYIWFEDTSSNDNM